MKIKIEKKIDNQKLGESIKIYRLKAKMTQEELASKIDVSNTYISQLERGIHSPSLEAFIAICSALKIEPSTLLEMHFTDKDDVFVVPTKCIELCKITQNLNNDQIESLINIVKNFRK